MEAYRRNAAAFSRDRGRFGGRVALVTGAAQGFGLEIARGLVAAGGHVVLADVNAALAAERAAELEAAHGPGRAWSVAMDVTRRSLGHGRGARRRRALRRPRPVRLERRRPAGRLGDGPVAGRLRPRHRRSTTAATSWPCGPWHPSWPASTRPGRSYLGDIVEINSKSGLEGSKRNFAYAGSKFGGIGLTQSFALELIEDGIKVNAVCPGNYLDGPLWSDPENGLFVQYLREGKVPGAATIEDVRHAYEAKVPMGRGCTPADVLEAILYLVAQQYETGQALPVTGGQVMLS